MADNGEPTIQDCLDAIPVRYVDYAEDLLGEAFLKIRRFQQASKRGYSPYRSVHMDDYRMEATQAEDDLRKAQLRPFESRPDEQLSETPDFSNFAKLQNFDSDHVVETVKSDPTRLMLYLLLDTLYPESGARIDLDRSKHDDGPTDGSWWERCWMRERRRSIEVTSYVRQERVEHYEINWSALRELFPKLGSPTTSPTTREQNGGNSGDKAGENILLPMLPVSRSTQATVTCTTTCATCDDKDCLMVHRSENNAIMALLTTAYIWHNTEIEDDELPGLFRLWWKVFSHGGNYALQEHDADLDAQTEDCELALTRTLQTLICHGKEVEAWQERRFWAKTLSYGDERDCRAFADYGEAGDLQKLAFGWRFKEFFNRFYQYVGNYPIFVSVPIPEGCLGRSVVDVTVTRYGMSRQYSLSNCRYLTAGTEAGTTLIRHLLESHPDVLSEEVGKNRTQRWHEATARWVAWTGGQYLRLNYKWLRHSAFLTVSYPNICLGLEIINEKQPWPFRSEFCSGVFFSSVRLRKDDKRRLGESIDRPHEFKAMLIPRLRVMAKFWGPALMQIAMILVYGLQIIGVSGGDGNPVTAMPWYVWYTLLLSQVGMAAVWADKDEPMVLTRMLASMRLRFQWNLVLDLAMMVVLVMLNLAGEGFKDAQQIAAGGALLHLSAVGVTILKWIGLVLLVADALWMSIVPVWIVIYFRRRHLARTHRVWRHRRLIAVMRRVFAVKDSIARTFGFRDQYNDPVARGVIRTPGWRW